MQTRLHILLLEDDLADAELIAQELEAAGFSFHITRIQTEAQLRRELNSRTPDLVLSDHGLPSFDGFKALKIVREMRPSLPFIFVSGSNDQGMVVQMHEQGATDYVFKNDLGDLKAAVQLALRPGAAESHGQPEHRSNTMKVLPFAVPSRLRFCPECLQARDESDTLVHLGEFFQNHAEVMVIREACMFCGRSRRI